MSNVQWQIKPATMLSGQTKMTQLRSLPSCTWKTHLLLIGSRECSLLFYFPVLSGYRHNCSRLIWNGLRFPFVVKANITDSLTPFSFLRFIARTVFYDYRTCKITQLKFNLSTPILKKNNYRFIHNLPSVHYLAFNLCSEIALAS